MCTRWDSIRGHMPTDRSNAPILPNVLPRKPKVQQNDLKPASATPECKVGLPAKARHATWQIDSNITANRLDIAVEIACLVQQTNRA